METSTIYDRVRIFDRPIAYILLNQRAEELCSFCLRRPMATKLQLCGNCRFARYCNKDCQRQAWKDHHKLECARLKKVFPYLPVTEAIFLGRIADKVNFIEKNGDVHEWQKDRRWDELMTHEEDIRKDEEKMQHFEKMYEKTIKYMGDDMPEKEKFFLIFCRTWINSHSIHTSVGDEVGMAMDLGIIFFHIFRMKQYSLSDHEENRVGAIGG